MRGPHISTREEPPLSAAREGSGTAVKTQRSQKKKKESISSEPSARPPPHAGDPSSQVTEVVLGKPTEEDNMCLGFLSLLNARESQTHIKILDDLIIN